MIIQPKLGPKHFTSSFKYNYIDRTISLTIEDPKKIDAALLRKVDPWGLSYYEFIKDQGAEIKTVLFAFPNINDDFQAHLQSLIRRISYLNIINKKIEFQIRIDQDYKKLFSFDELNRRPKNEIIQSDINERSGKDKPGKFEKDLQVFLFDEAGNDRKRLGILGEDFINLEDINFGIFREFATGVFNNKKFERNRILPKWWIDFVTFNKHKKLSLIELKVNDSKISVLSQILDYALYFVSYKYELISLIRNNNSQGFIPDNIEDKSFIVYVANNNYHPKFDKISKYYIPSKNFGFQFVKLVFGKTQEFSAINNS